MSENGQTGGFVRWLYWSYSRGSSVSHFLRSRVRPAAWLLMGGCGASALMGTNVEKSLVALLSLLFFSLLMVGFVWACFRKAQISAQRELPRTGAVGELLTYQVTLKNKGERELRDFSIRETGDDSRPTEWEFTHLREPAEDHRNIFDRTFAFYRWQWLSDRGGMWEERGRSEVLTIAPGGATRASLSVMPLRRGLLCLHDLRAELPDPMGLFQRRRVIENEKQEVLIIPKRYRLPRLPYLELGGKSELKVGGETASNVRGEGGEFMGLREYREGDSLRKIHWKAWARTGRAIVKEFEEVRFPRYGLVLDTNLKESGPSLLEEAVSVAASFVSRIDRESCLLDLMFVREEPEVFTAGRGVARADRLMEVLARVEGSEEGGYESLRQLVLQYSSEMATCVVVLCGWCPAREDFLKRLRASGMELLVYLIGAEETLSVAEKAGVKCLRVEHMQEDLLKA